MADEPTDDPIVVSEAAVAEHEPAVRGILVEYVTWLEGVVGGGDFCTLALYGF